jgi:hypothetical protein
MKRVKLYIIIPVITTYLLIELSFLVANITKFAEGLRNINHCSRFDIHYDHMVFG